MARKKFDYDLIVIGSGAGGSVAAHIVAGAGKRVAMVESDTLGGETPNWGGIPIRALLHAAEVYDSAKHGGHLGIRSGAMGYNYPSIRAWKDLVVKRTGSASSKSYHESGGVTVIEGAAHFISPNEITVNRRHLTAENFLIATGSKWYMPAIDGLDRVGYLTARTALDVIRPPKSVFIVGASSTGCEIATAFSIFGSKVYIADISTRILPSEDSEVGELLQRSFEKRRGMTVLTSSKVLRVAKEGVVKRVTFERGGREQSVKVDEVLLAAGKSPYTDVGLENAGVEYSAKGIAVNDQLQTSVKHIFAAGDVIGGHMLTHVSTYESRVAAHNMLHRDKVRADYSAVPRVTFTQPEVASVGYSEDYCTRRDWRIKKAVAPLSVIARANTSNVQDGFVKVITDAKSGKLLGATVVSPSAGEIIHELTLAIQHDMNASDIAGTPHAFGTWSEAVRVACGKVTK